MRLIRQFVAACSLGLLALGAMATPANPQPGTDYRVLDTAQPTEPGKKVEVTEFFWYACPHCFALEPSLNDWVKKNSEHIVYKRVPVAFRDSFIPQQKLYYTLEALGEVERLHGKVFNAIHVDRQALNTDATITDFVVKNGVDKKKFLDAYNSFGVQTKSRRATQLQADYKIDGVPTLAVGGKYLTSPSIVGAAMGSQPEPVLHGAALQVLSHLVAKVEKEGGAAAKK
ncbi:MAG: thiol:disulfide interchange protein DsbA [Paucimonas sp.]|jgi:thiol:disulfide interchange protein DsbA|nr:thiol:disulfide interchange protein DsbA [Paucimonas sp.]